MNLSSLRDEVAAQLSALTAADAIAGLRSARTTHRFYAADPRRRQIRQGIIDRYLDTSGNPGCDGQSVIITAGVPGAGKSTAVTAQVPDPESYRELDADIVKDYLLEQAVADGIFDDLSARPLADGKPVQPRELAALVHRESTRIVDQLRRECIGRNENLIIHGTLTWSEAGKDILADLGTGDYRRLQILDVEVPESLAQTRALQRWWQVRDADTDPLGGRFTPPAVITAAYGAEESLCAANARALFRDARATTFGHVVLTVITPEGTRTLQ